MANKCYLIDIDDTIVPHGSEDISQEIIDLFNKIKSEGHSIYLFTCKTKGCWRFNFERQGLKFDGVIEKPIADKYVFIDDKFEFGSNKIEDIAG